MPFKSKKIQKIYNKKYRQKNKKRIQKKRKAYYQKHKKKICQQMRDHYKKNPKPKKDNTRRWRKNNPKRAYALVKKWHKKHPRRLADMYLKHHLQRYGISVEDFKKAKKEQKSLCKICKRKRKLCVDHCHKRLIFRGLLCQQCNTGLGGFEDRPDLLRKAAEYLSGF